MNSVAAGVIVHAAYNFTLFAGVLYQTADSAIWNG